MWIISCPDAVPESKYSQKDCRCTGRADVVELISQCPSFVGESGVATMDIAIASSQHRSKIADESLTVEPLIVTVSLPTERIDSRGSSECRDSSVMFKPLLQRDQQRSPVPRMYYTSQAFVLTFPIRGLREISPYLCPWSSGYAVKMMAKSRNHLDRMSVLADTGSCTRQYHEIVMTNVCEAHML